MNNKTLVIGGGIAGIRSAMDLAERGVLVYLVEAGPDIGGKVARFDCLLCKICHRYFPAKGDYEKMICGVCYVPELINEAKKNKNIKIYNHSTVERIEKVGDTFKVLINRKSDKKTGSCIFEDIAGERKIEVGSVILSPGFESFDPSALSIYGYRHYENVVTSFEFEEMIRSYGSDTGFLKRPSDGKTPRKIGFIQCVGSRDRKNGNPYCSSVCCMHSLKEAVMAQEAVPDMETYIFFMDMRAFGKQLEEYYQEAKKHNIKFIRNNRISNITEDPDTKNLRLNYIEGDELKEAEFDMVVLAVGMNPPRGSEKLAELLGIELNDYKFCKTDTLFSPSMTSVEGVYVGGVFSGPKDLPGTVAQASSAAACATACPGPGISGTIETEEEYPAQKDIFNEKPRIGVFLGHWENEGGILDLPAISENIKNLPEVEYCEIEKHMNCPEYQHNLQKKIKEHNLNRVVVAGRPKVMEQVVRNSMKKVALNPYMVDYANIYEQCSLVHEREPEQANRKAIDLVRMAVAKCKLLEPLEPYKLSSNKSGLIIGGGLTGMTAALGLAKQGFFAYLIEKESELGGLMRRIHYELSPGNSNGMHDVQERLKALKSEIHINDRIDVFTNAKILDITGSVGDFTTTIDRNGEIIKIDHGIIIIATGGMEHQPTEYLYDTDENVVTQLELEERLATRGKLDARTIVMIHCVGCRNDERQYCSRVCCLESIKNALKIKELDPEAEVYMLFRDLRTYGFSEIFYEEAARQGIKFIRWHKDKPPVVKNENGLTVSIIDMFIDEVVEINTDLIALGAATIPSEENSKLSELLKLRTTKNNFFLERHTKFRPVEFDEDGIYLCGLAHSPKFFQECISEAEAAVSRASTFLWKDHIELDPQKSVVIDKNCDGCAYCVDPCPYNAITLLEYMKNDQVKRTVEVNVGRCKGCGTCMATCPKKGVMVMDFTLDQITAMVDAVLNEE